MKSDADGKGYAFLFWKQVCNKMVTKDSLKPSNNTKD